VKKSKAVLDYHEDNFAIVFAAMGVRKAVRSSLSCLGSSTASSDEGQTPSPAS
jgi:vacuolar-type H+-ATPase subunit B/Vma2